MARIRSVKPAFYTDEELNDLPLEAHFLYGGLFCQADLEGRLEDKPRTIKLAVFPFRDVDVEPLLDTLAKPKGGRADGKPFILRYTAGPTRIIQIVEFKKHQRITGKEAESSSVFPPHPDWETLGKQWGINRETTETTGREGKGVQEGKGKEKDFCSDGNKPPELPMPEELKKILPTLKRVKLEDPATLFEVWKAAFPDVGIVKCILACDAWAVSKKVTRTPKGWARTLNTWLGKEQDRAPEKVSPKNNGVPESKAVLARLGL